MTWLVKNWGTILIIVMVLWALTDPRPRYDRTRRSRRYRERDYWR